MPLASGIDVPPVNPDKVALLYKSQGYKPSRKSTSSLTKEEIRKLYFSTTSSRDVPGRVSTEEERGENFYDVHGIGQRTSKYMDYQMKTAPLIQRSACSHTSQFVPMVLGDNVVNRQLADSFKEGWQAGKGPSLAPMTANSVSFEDFPAATAAQMARCTPYIEKPDAMERTSTICTKGDLMETQSHEQNQYRNKSEGKRKKREAPLSWLYRGSMDIGGAPPKVPTGSAYYNEFGPSSPAVIRSIIRSSSVPLARTQVYEEDPVFKATQSMRRGPHLRPGV